MRAFFREDDIDREGSFLGYFNQMIRQLIGEPYRQGVNSTISFRESTDATGHMEVHDTTTYVCRAVGGRIQDDVAWYPEPGEFEEVLALSVRLRTPPAFPPPPTLGGWTRGNDGTYLYEARVPQSGGDMPGCRVSLEPFRGCDGLSVRVDSTYRVRAAALTGWKMAHPTNGFVLTLHYPPEYRARCEFMGVHEPDVVQCEEPGLCQVHYDTWVLPTAGLAFQVERRGDTPPR